MQTGSDLIALAVSTLGDDPENSCFRASLMPRAIQGPSGPIPHLLRSWRLCASLGSWQVDRLSRGGKLPPHGTTRRLPAALIDSNDLGVLQLLIW